MEKNFTSSLILDSKILNHYINYVGLIKMDQYFNYVDVLKSFLLLFLIPRCNKILYKKLLLFLPNEISITILAYKKDYIFLKKNEEVQIMLSNKQNWVDIINIYKLLPEFMELLRNDVHIFVSMVDLSHIFSFESYKDKNIRMFENLKMNIKDKIGYNNEYHFLLLIYVIFYQVDCKLFKKFNYFINMENVKEYFKEIEGSVLEEKQEERILNSIKS